MVSITACFLITDTNDQLLPAPATGTSPTVMDCALELGTKINPFSLAVAFVRALDRRDER